MVSIKVIHIKPALLYPGALCGFNMVLYIIGLGLTGTDISLNGLEILKNCKHIYLESYTSILMDSDTNQLESLIGKTVIIVDRYFVEMKFESILQDSILNNIALLIVGDVFAATTHTDLYLRGIKQGIPIKIVHNISIINAISVTGLQVVMNSSSYIDLDKLLVYLFLKNRGSQLVSWIKSSKISK